jgi:hypothetical protein
MLRIGTQKAVILISWRGIVATTRSIREYALILAKEKKNDRRQ